FLDDRALERKAEDGGDDPQPELAARAPARHATDLRPNAELAQELERVAQAVGDALEHRAGERPAVVAELEPDERAARVRIRVRGPLAREVGREQEAVGARRPALGFAEQRLVRRVERVA